MFNCFLLQKKSRIINYVFSSNQCLIYYFQNINILTTKNNGSTLSHKKLIHQQNISTNDDNVAGADDVQFECVNNQHKMKENNNKLMFKNKRLIALDFDHTIVSKNSDLVVRDLIDVTKIPNNVKLLYKKTGWTPYMRTIFEILHENGIRKMDIINAIDEIPEVRGMQQLIRTLKENNFDVIIISDSNCELINIWLKANNLCKFVDKIFSNPAQFNDTELLEIQPYHHQTECTLSSINLCKGKILEDFIKMKTYDGDATDSRQQQFNTFYKNVFYVGDGHNDICPILQLKANDFGCVRQGFSLDNEITRLNKTHNLTANVIRWNNGNELYKEIIKQLTILNDKEEEEEAEKQKCK